MASAPPSPRLAAAPTAFILAFLFSSALPAQPASVLRDVRFWSSKDSTRIALETSGEAKYKFDRLQNPERIYVDLLDVRPNQGFRGLAYTVPVEDGLVKQVRVALNQRGITRVVIDLESQADLQVSQLTNPDRVILEVRKAGSPIPAHEAQWQPQPAPAQPAPAQPALSLSAAPAPKPFTLPQPRTSSPARPFTIDLAKMPRFSPPSKLPARPSWLDRNLRESPPEGKLEAATSGDDAAPALPAKPNRLGNRSLTRVLGLKLNRVVLDPGHGGQDNGTTSKNGLVEKELVLDVALRLGKLLEDRIGSEVVYTREDDRFVPLQRRTAIANEKSADLFLSIHANSSPYKYIAGSETYYLSFTNSQVDLDVALRENASSEKSIHELSDIIKKVILNEKLEESREFADKIQTASYDLTAQNNAKTRNRGVKKAPFVVLIDARMPSVLTEIGFLSNPKEESLMMTPEYRQKIAESLYKGIAKYGETLSHFAATPAQSVEKNRPGATAKLAKLSEVQ